MPKQNLPQVTATLSASTNLQRQRAANDALVVHPAVLVNESSVSFGRSHFAFCFPFPFCFPFAFCLPFAFCFSAGASDIVCSEG